jgi:hypothetical protein
LKLGADLLLPNSKAGTTACEIALRSKEMTVTVIGISRGLNADATLRSKLVVSSILGSQAHVKYLDNIIFIT